MFPRQPAFTQPLRTRLPKAMREAPRRRSICCSITSRLSRVRHWTRSSRCKGPLARTALYDLEPDVDNLCDISLSIQPGQDELCGLPADDAPIDANRGQRRPRVSSKLEISEANQGDVSW